MKNFFEYRLFALLLLALFAFVGVFFRGDLFGFDAYAGWACVKGISCTYLVSQPFAIALFQLLPDSLIVFKWVMFASFFLALIPVFLLVKHFFEERVAWLVTFCVVGLSPIFVFGFGQFENELFAYPFLFWALYLVVQKSWWKKVLSVVLVGVAAGFWAPSLLWLIPLSVLWLPVFVLLVTGTFWAWNNILLYFGVGQALEQTFLGGVYQFFGYLLVIPFFFLTKNKRLLVAGASMLFFALVSPKVVVLAVPFVAIGIAELIKLLEERGKSINFLLYLSFFCLIGVNIAFFMQSPMSSDWVFVGEAVKISQDQNLVLIADWSYDYWVVIYTNKKLPYDSQYEKRYNEITPPFIALTKQELPCELLKEEVTAIRRRAIYKCT